MTSDKSQTLLQAVGMAEAADEPIDLDSLADELSTSVETIRFELDQLQGMGLTNGELSEEEAEHAQLAELAGVHLGENPPLDSRNKLAKGWPLLLRPTQLNGAGRPSEWTTEPTRLGRPGDVVISVRGANLGATAVLDREYSIGRSFALVQPQKTSADAVFLQLALEAEASRLRAIAKGTTIPSIPLKTLQTTPLFWPPAAARRQVGQALTTFSHKVELNHRLQKTLVELAETLYRHEINDQTSAGAEFTPPPAGWSLKELGELAEALRGTVDPRMAAGETFESFSFEGFNSGRVPQLVQGTTLNSRRKHLSEDALLLSLLKPEAWRVWWAKPSGNAIAVCSPEFLVLRPRTVPLAYLHAVLRFDHDLREHVLSLDGGATPSRRRVRAREVLTVHVPVPPPGELARISRMLEPLLRLEARLTKETAILERLRQSLVPRLVSGELAAPTLDGRPDGGGR